VERRAKIVVRGRQVRQMSSGLVYALQGFVVTVLPDQKPAQGVQAGAGVGDQGDMPPQERFGFILPRPIGDQQSQHAQGLGMVWSIAKDKTIQRLCFALPAPGVMR
jgi:hypothetical protein